MKVFKFGGASVKSAEAVRNLAVILENYTETDLVVVVSAMGKTTSALEALVQMYYENWFEGAFTKTNYSSVIAEKEAENTKFLAASAEKLSSLQTKFDEIKNYHYDIVNQLFVEENELLNNELSRQFDEIKLVIEKPAEKNFNKLYDAIISKGELISTLIVSRYLEFSGISNQWLDVRKLIVTDSYYREANVNLPKTAENIAAAIQFNKTKLYVTQGFLGADTQGNTTTLGREGSDYTAAIFAYSLNAESLTVWKDVAGVYNADPKRFPDAVLLKCLSYGEAVDQTYFGATVIHPKTLKPIQNKKIPLFVRSFVDPEAPGTKIADSDQYDKKVPVYISKSNQMLISLSPTDFSFVSEENLSLIFAMLSKYRISVNLMQAAAVNFTVCVDNNPNKLVGFLNEVSKKYSVKYNENLELLTVRHYTSEVIDRVLTNRELLVEQRNRETV
ncbi:MAG TPA: aspartate kinase, partial [Bacteroidales bacterium]|nr:aspartate kinase [Bacteroidales bacterium]